MIKTTLLIMAAGIGSRFGGGIKQLTPVGPNKEIIMDYSIHDAIEAGFNKIIFIIRKDIEEDFKDIIGNRIEKICTAHNVEVGYCFQDLHDLPQGIVCPEGRTKSWGTGQAVLAAKDLGQEPFCVINADDYYGKQAFKLLHDFLVKGHKDNEFAMAGFVLKNTLSDNGTVTRGVCEVNEEGYLTDVHETHDIAKTKNGAEVNGQALDPEANVSMNMWALSPAFMQTLEDGFVEFFENNKDPMKGEYLIPVYIGELLEQGKVSVKVLETNDHWFGVTYAEDKDFVIDSFRELVDKGVYKSGLFIGEYCKFL